MHHKDIHNYSDLKKYVVFHIKRENRIIRTWFYKFIEKSYRDTTGALYSLFLCAVLFVIIVLSFNVIVNNPAVLGPWGDFFGGVLNPLLTFLTFTGLLITIALQQTELRESRNEFKRSADALDAQNKVTERQIFESTFFQMLALHNNIVESIRITTMEGSNAQGRGCFDALYGEFNLNYIKSRIKGKVSYDEGDERRRIEKGFSDFWKYRQSNLGHYYRYMYNMVRFVYEKGPKDETYIRLLRAQISDQELLLLFYNCLTPQGEKFKVLAEHFSIFNNMNKERLIIREHIGLMSPKAYGDGVIISSPTEA